MPQTQLEFRKKEDYRRSFSALHCPTQYLSGRQERVGRLVIDPQWDSATVGEASIPASLFDDHEDLRSRVRRQASRVDNLVGMRARDIRVARGVSQSALGEAIGVTAQQIQKYESGTNRMSVSTLLWVARTLGAPISAFFEDIEAQGSSAPTPLFDRQSADLLQNFCRIQSPAMRAKLVEFVRRLAVNRRTTWPSAGLT